MFDTLLIANRGEIACRVAASARRLGVRTVAVYSEADVGAPHVAACDTAVCVGPAAARDSYLRGERIIEAALATGAQAIHPGYGFLSENAAFAEACAAAGLVFVGPPPAALRAMGLKAESKRLMEQAGVPLVPGYHGADQADATLRAQAARIGLPLLIKASAGGGGKGMRSVLRAEDFDAALASCRREAAAAFGDEAVLLERLIQRPRHIEIQVFGDTHGALVHLHERDCSVQRRHQKVLEEAPAPGLDAGLRQRMGEAALAAARAVAYVGAGTVEFIAEPRADGGLDFYFMEMNTRLQVEHPVTEAITGLDLVEWQLRVAAGEPLPLRQDQIPLRGHAIEARLCAEDPDQDYRPGSGTLALFRTPAARQFEVASLRLDSGVQEGGQVQPHYDSMIAKLIVHGDTREQALARLSAALAETRVVGVASNLGLLRRLAVCTPFRRADLDTALIERARDELFGVPVPEALDAAALAVAWTLQAEQALAGADPFSQRDGWNSHHDRVRGWRWTVGDVALQAELRQAHDGGMVLSLQVGEQMLCAPLQSLPSGEAARVRLRWGERLLQGWVDAHGASLHVAGARLHLVLKEVPAFELEDGITEGGGLNAPMPGKVVAFAVAGGEAVHAGQVLVVMEAMKMEHTLKAPFDGVVDELLYAPGDLVGEGAPLLRMTRSD